MNNLTLRDPAFLGRSAAVSVNPFDDIESYSNLAALGGLNGGTNWAGAYVDRPSVTGVQSHDDVESYSSLAILNGLNGGNWTAGAYVDRTGFLGIQTTDDAESYADLVDLNALNGGTGWAGAYVDRGSLITGLVSYWTLDEASGTRDDAHAANNLTDNNTVGQAAGKIGNAGLFINSNSEFLSVADNATLDFTTAFTVSAWIYGDNLEGNAGIVAKWNYSTDGCWAFQLDSAGTGLQVFIATTAADGGNTWQRFTTLVLQSATWYHVVLVYDGTLTAADRAKVYVDSVLQTATTTTGTWPASLLNSGAELRIGDFQGLNRYWLGRIDEVGLWSRALTAAECVQLYNAGTGTTYPL